MINKYREHQNFANKVMLHVQKKYSNIRLWQIATGQAYAKFSVKDAITYALKTRDIVGAMKKLIVIVYGKEGHPDITGILSGIWIGIEIKTGKARQSDVQRNFQKMIEQAGGCYIVVSNAFEIDAQIEQLEKINEWWINANRIL